MMNAADRTYVYSYTKDTSGVEQPRPRIGISFALKSTDWGTTFSNDMISLDGPFSKTLNTEQRASPQCPCGAPIATLAAGCWLLHADCHESMIRPRVGVLCLSGSCRQVSLGLVGADTCTYVMVAL
jgi:hypothetical protein